MGLMSSTDAGVVNFSKLVGKYACLTTTDTQYIIYVYTDAMKTVVTHRIMANIVDKDFVYDGEGTICTISIDWEKYKTPGMVWGSYDNIVHVLHLKFIGGCEKIIAGSPSWYIEVNKFEELL